MARRSPTMPRPASSAPGQPSARAGWNASRFRTFRRSCCTVASMSTCAPADLRNVTVFADAEVDRSPCGTGTAAVMAVVDAMGLLADAQPFVHESLIGTRFNGRVTARTTVGEYPAIVPEIEGSAWITGEHTFIVDDADPLKEGFRV